jgi:CRISPR/Cas system CSM-associated protein Csm3 (group 7 of RAMP superfamily)
MPERIDSIDLTYTLTFESAFHCGSGLPRLLLDRGVQRDAEGFLYVPASTVKGALRDRCEQIARLFGLTARSPHDESKALDEYVSRDMLSRLFGSRLHPGQLFVDDLKMQHSERDFFGNSNNSMSLQTSERTQVSLSRRTGTARPQMLFSSEFGLTDLRFDGEICGYVSDLPLDDTPDSPTYALLLLLAGLASLDRLGGNKSTGVGRCSVQNIIMTINNLWSAVIPAWMNQVKCLEDADVAWEVELG